MKIDVIGGGPAGLYFAILAKKSFPRFDIRVHERNQADDTFGFGVVFSDATLDNFERADPESYEAITGRFAYWDDIEIHIHGAVHRIGGNGFCGCSRRTLLILLQERARALGVELIFRAEIADLDELRSIRSHRRGGRHQQPHPRGPQGRISAPNVDLRPNWFCLDGLVAPLRRLHLLLQGDRARHLHRPLLPIRSRPLDLGVRDRSRDLWKARPRPDGRGGLGALPRGHLRRGARRPPAPRPIARCGAASRRSATSAGRCTTTSCSWAMPRRRRISRSARARSSRWRMRSRSIRRSSPARATSPARSSASRRRGARRSRRRSTRPMSRSSGSST